MYLLLIISFILLLVAFLYWLLVTTEGAFLGQRAVVWLYDITAHRYDNIKQFDAADERFFLTSPLLRSIEGIQQPLILDVATGSGRVPFDLITDPKFSGLVVGLDPAEKMLDQARDKLNLAGEGAEQVMLVRQSADLLPLASKKFDVVICLESLEFFPSTQTALLEMYRVMKPGGLLMTSRRRGLTGQLFLNRYKSVEQFETILSEINFQDIKTNLWELDYDLVTARKPHN